MKKVIRLTESQLEEIIKKVISEEDNKSYKGSLIDIAQKENLIPNGFPERKYVLDPNHKWVIIRVDGNVKVAGISSNLSGKQFTSKDFIDLTGGGEILFHSIDDEKFVYVVDTKGKNGIRIHGSWN